MPDDVMSEERKHFEAFADTWIAASHSQTVRECMAAMKPAYLMFYEEGIRRERARHAEGRDALSQALTALHELNDACGQEIAEYQAPDSVQRVLGLNGYEGVARPDAHASLADDGRITTTNVVDSLLTHPKLQGTAGDTIQDCGTSSPSRP